MKKVFKCVLLYSLLAGLIYLSGCNDDEDPGPQLTGESKSYVLGPVSNGGTVTFAERDDDQVLITIQLSGTQAGNTHPAHIHANNAAEPGEIILDLTAVNGTTGKSETVVKALNDGTAISYDELLGLDGYVNVHNSESDLATLVAQGDIGQNELTGDSKVYTLTPVADPLVTGTATFAKRVNAETLVTVALTNTQPGATHNSHIHAKTIAEGGAIVINLTAVDGTTGKAVSNVSKMNDVGTTVGAPITYEELLNFDGYLNVHVGSSFVVQADIGQNELTGETEVYTLSPVLNPLITGTATFAKRKNGMGLVTVALTNTVAGTYNSHIHENTVADVGEAIVVDLTAVNGTTGKAQTSVKARRNGTPVTYADLINFNGYINVHSGSSFLAQGDIGQNELTGDHEHYDLAAFGGSGVSGSAAFEKRKNGKTLITLGLTGTTAGASHPAHIHANSATAGGAIVLDLTNVNGTTGGSATSVNTMKDGSAVTYEQLIGYNGHINVHTSAADLATITQGNIGSNAQ